MSIARLMQMAAAGAAEPTDPYFNQTVLLLHGDGTNGAQNNTFLDSSTNNFTITRNGNTTQGTFSPFSLPNGEWSNYFDGSGDYFTSADSADWAFGSGNFTLEAWVYRTVGGATQMILIQSDNASAAGSAWSLYITSGNKLQSYVYYGSSFIGLTSSANVPQNEWVHVALVRTSGTVSQYINGSRDGTNGSLSTNSLNDVAQTIGIGGTNAGGDLLTGYLSNVRIIKGSGPYDATSTTLTVPTSPFSAATSNQKLLTCYSSRFVDANTATTAKTITVNGNPSVQPFSPFLPSAAYDPSVNGGSAYMGITSENLVTPTNTAFQLGSGNFTIEWWYYWTQERNPAYLFRTDNGVAISGLMLYYNGSNFVAYGSTTGSSWDIWNGDTVASFSRMQNRWVHLALVRNGTSFKWYVDGVSVTTGTVTASAINQTANLFTINAIDGQGGYWSNFRYVKGTAVYTSDFTPPTAPITAVSGTELLLNFTNAGIFDNTGKNNLVTFGNAQIDTTTKKYGTGSMEFDGTGDWLAIPSNPNIDLRSGNFTIEGWINTNSNSTQQGVVTMWGNPETQFQIEINTSGKIVFAWAAHSTASYLITGSTTISASTWYHIAVVRDGSTFTLYLNGTSDGSGTSSANATSSTTMYVGASDVSGSVIRPFTGFIDDLRITKGIARYTANFTPPSQAFPNL